MELAAEHKKFELETELKNELQGGSVNQKPAVNTSLGKPRLPALNLSTDHVDLYLERFERHCASMKWPKEDWPSCLVNFLSGEALTIFLSLDSEESKYYDKVKETLLVHFNCTESGFRRSCRLNLALTRTWTLF